MKYTFTAALLLCFLFSYGCSKPAPTVITKTEYLDVYIPVNCTAPMPKRPMMGKDLPIVLFDLIEYVKQLEITIKICRGDE